MRICSLTNPRMSTKLAQPASDVRNSSTVYFHKCYYRNNEKKNGSMEVCFITKQQTCTFKGQDPFLLQQRTRMVCQKPTLKLSIHLFLLTSDSTIYTSEKLLVSRLEFGYSLKQSCISYCINDLRHKEIQRFLTARDYFVSRIVSMFSMQLILTDGSIHNITGNRKMKIIVLK